MKITYPRMGDWTAPLGGMLEQMGLTVVRPPTPSDRTRNIGARLSPEFICYPLKLNLGNYVEAYELGADTVLMAGGVGPCRFGYYATIQKDILADAGYPMEFIVLEPPKGHALSLLSQLRKLVQNVSLCDFLRAVEVAWLKLQAMEDIHILANQVRAVEAVTGQTSAVYKQQIALLDSATTVESVKGLWSRAREALYNIKKVRRERVPVVRLIGEIYMISEPFANLDVEERLGRMGVCVENTLSLVDYIRQNLIADVLRMHRDRSLQEEARPYLAHFVGGEGVESVGNTVRAAKQRCDGVVHVMPFTCMPEIVAQSVIPTVSEEYGIPVLTLILDEHSAEAGIQTRLEAFVDLIQNKREAVRNRV